MSDKHNSAENSGLLSSSYERIFGSTRTGVFSWREILLFGAISLIISTSMAWGELYLVILAATSVTATLFLLAAMKIAGKVKIFRWLGLRKIAFPLTFFLSFVASFLAISGFETLRALGIIGPAFFTFLLIVSGMALPAFSLVLCWIYSAIIKRASPLLLNLVPAFFAIPYTLIPYYSARTEILESEISISAITAFYLFSKYMVIVGIFFLIISFIKACTKFRRDELPGQRPGANSQLTKNHIVDRHRHEK